MPDLPTLLAELQAARQKYREARSRYNEAVRRAVAEQDGPRIVGAFGQYRPTKPP